ncbi:MAG: hypothetical protein SFT94_12350 [Pseudanabaenaceae cyanobacterium bins.68]|nr:hypothetical protein [Pseudanabaenaceae cyanobacterium bins.68]
MPNYVHPPAATPKTRMIEQQLGSVEEGKNDFELFTQCFLADGSYQFGNFHPSLGRAGILQGFYNLVPLVKGDFTKVKVNHDIWILEEVADKVFVQMDTIYKIDGEEKLRLPCFAVYHFSGELDSEGREYIKKLQTFLDSSPLFMDTSALIPNGDPFKGLPE